MPKWLIYAIWSCEALGLLQINIASGSLPAGGQWCPAPPFQICAPPFHVWPPGCCIHPIQYFKNVPPFWFLAPLLLNPGDGPVSHPPPNWPVSATGITFYESTLLATSYIEYFWGTTYEQPYCVNILYAAFRAFVMNCENQEISWSNSTSFQVLTTSWTVKGTKLLVEN